MPPSPAETPPAAPLDALPFPAMVAQGEVVRFANAAATELFGARATAPDQPVEALRPAGAELARLARRVSAGDGAQRQAATPGGHELAAAPLEGGAVLITLHAMLAPEVGAPGAELVAAAAGLGRTLAHEIKNPLAGIRGAAQLLRADADPAARDLLQVIVDETDRIRRLVDAAEALSDERPGGRTRVNLHRVLGRVRALTQAATPRPLAVRERYDPSLPHAWGDEDA
ncbi:MAG: ATPase, partial [Caulobacteraceae bacterium]|nr:ATPase [Caulobacter sp.]